jgi:hypothetical protein
LNGIRPHAAGKGSACHRDRRRDHQRDRPRVGSHHSNPNGDHQANNNPNGDHQANNNPKWGAQPTTTQQPPPPRRKLSGCLTALLIVVGIFVVAGIIGALTGSGDNTAQQSTPATEPRPEPTAGKPATTARGDDLREPKRDGQFEFTVQSVKCGRRTVGSSGLTQTAQGQYCLVAVKVANVGDEARTFDSSSQYLFDSRGRKFETDDATLYLEDNGNAFLENINPGNSVNGTLVYDVPHTGFEAAKLELHDSAFSGGVDVAL